MLNVGEVEEEERKSLAVWRSSHETNKDEGL